LYAFRQECKRRSKGGQTKGGEHRSGSKSESKNSKLSEVSTEQLPVEVLSPVARSSSPRDGNNKDTQKKLMRTRTGETPSSPSPTTLRSHLYSYHSSRYPFWQPSHDYCAAEPPLLSGADKEKAYNTLQGCLHILAKEWLIMHPIVLEKYRQVNIDTLTALLDTSAFHSSQLRMLTGSTELDPSTRDWLYDKVDSWINSPVRKIQDKVMLIVGKAGMGKTTAAAGFCQRNRGKVGNETAQSWSAWNNRLPLCMVGTPYCFFFRGFLFRSRHITFVRSSLLLHAMRSKLSNP